MVKNLHAMQGMQAGIGIKFHNRRTGVPWESDPRATPLGLSQTQPGAHIRDPHARVPACHGLDLTHNIQNPVCQQRRCPRSTSYRAAPAAWSPSLPAPAHALPPAPKLQVPACSAALVLSLRPTLASAGGAPPGARAR